MKQVDVYLKQLSFWLPAAQRERVLPEIRDALLDRLDNATTAAGRPLTDADVARELVTFGKPVTVAARYLHGRPVISSLLAVFYWRVLATALIGVFVVQTVVLLVHAGARDGTYMVHAAGQGAFGLLSAFAAVTLVFMVIDRGLSVSGGQRGRTS